MPYINRPIWYVNSFYPAFIQNIVISHFEILSFNGLGRKFHRKEKKRKLGSSFLGNVGMWRLILVNGEKNTAFLYTNICQKLWET